jgi:WXG100 family type VII secretion target
MVTAQELLNAATNCNNTNEQIQTQIQQMQQLIVNLEAAYTGTAALQLQSVSQQWQVDSQQLNTVLGTISQGLQSNAANYVNNENTNTTNLAGVGANLPAARL